MKKVILIGLITINFWVSLYSINPDQNLTKLQKNSLKQQLIHASANGNIDKLVELIEINKFQDKDTLEKCLEISKILPKPNRQIIKGLGKITLGTVGIEVMHLFLRILLYKLHLTTPIESSIKLLFNTRLQGDELRNLLIIKGMPETIVKELFQVKSFIDLLSQVKYVSQIYFIWKGISDIFKEQSKAGEMLAMQRYLEEKLLDIENKV